MYLLGIHAHHTPLCTPEYHL